MSPDWFLNFVIHCLWTAGSGPAIEPGALAGAASHIFSFWRAQNGKSSILKQLPELLGSQYLPVFYDLQTTGIASSTAALLAALAEGISDLLASRGCLLKTLEYDQLREDQRQNEAVVYHRFGRWLKMWSSCLRREGRVLLLAFDEFES